MTDNIIQHQLNIKSILYQYAQDGWLVFPVGRDKKPPTEHGFDAQEIDR